MLNLEKFIPKLWDITTNAFTAKIFVNTNAGNTA